MKEEIEFWFRCFKTLLTGKTLLWDDKGGFPNDGCWIEGNKGMDLKSMIRDKKLTEILK